MVAKIVEKMIPRITAPRQPRVSMMIVTTRPKMVTSDRHADEGAERQGRALGGDHDAAVDHADEQDEEADADDDRLLELQRDRLEDRLAEAGEHEDGDGHALEEDEAHGLREREALAEDEAERHDGVEAHAGSDGVGAVGDGAHEDRHDAGDETGGGEHGGEGQTLAAESEDTRVHEDDVGHDDERREPGKHVASECGAPLGEVEHSVETSRCDGCWDRPPYNGSFRLCRTRACPKRRVAAVDSGPAECTAGAAAG